MANNTGQVIKQLRISKGLTQEQLADIIGVKKNSVQKYENGTVKNIKIDTIRKLCNYFKIPPWFIIFPDHIGEFTIDELIGLLKNVDNISESRDFILFHLCLNTKGKEKALAYLKDLNRIPEYKENADINVPQ